jgi:hypothetical protein
VSISAQLTATFTAPNERPATALANWRSNRPEWLPDQYKEIDDSYNSVTWEWRHTPLSMKFVPGAKFFGGQTVYRLTALFDDDGRFGSKITVNGSCDPDTHQAIVAAADNVFDGGIV